MTAHPESTNREKIGFRPGHLWLMMGLALIGAVAIIVSLASHANIPNRVDVFNQRRPMKVLVGIKGDAQTPAFVGFIAVVGPQSRVLTVVPVSGQTPVHVAGQSLPLYQAVSTTSAERAAALVSQAVGEPVSHYFFITGSDLQLLLNALYLHSRGWPRSETPLTMLNILGYPSGRTAPAEEIRLLTEIVDRLPTVSPMAASALLSIPKTSVTNLTSYQLFLLANYVRGDTLAAGHLSRPAHTQGRGHG